jgi:DNA primase
VSLSPAFLDELRARTPLAALVGRRVKLGRSGRNWTGCCPFHGEKTPSFYVYEDHYHCFGCGAHGDAISFAMQAQGLSFPDAVAQLAAEAGLEVPKASPRAAEAERQRLDLGAVLEAAQGSFARRLRETEGAAGLAYLRGRGLSDETIARFGLGWSGDGRGGLTRELVARGIEPGQMLDAGLLREGDGGERRELFFNRVTFPIRDRRGRVVSFGGRTLGDGKPKYLNGPETSLFHKRRTLFALDAAREGVRAGGELLVVEGYMDAIALHQAGFAGAVAPLGTALTEEQLEELWRLAPVPVLCFDGDAAGSRAAARAAEVALPHLTPDRGLRIATLPPGEDPDSLVRGQGRAAMQAVLDAARPLSDALYALLSEGAAATPEGRAGLRRRLEACAGRIGDKALAAEYRRALLDRFFGERRAKGRGRPAAAPARPVLTAEFGRRERAVRLTALLLRHPALLPDVEEAFAGLDLPPPLGALRGAMHAWLEAHPAVLDSGTLLSHLDASGFSAEAGQVLASASMFLKDCARPDAMPAEVELVWWKLYQLFGQDRLAEEVAAAGREFEARGDPAARDRIASLRAAQAALLAIGSAEDSEV